MVNQLTSVAICTFNRAASLARTLGSIAAQTGIEELSWELLLIDNNSTDHTKLVAESYAEELPLRYIFEPAQGLSAARNRALKEFAGDLLIFTDDDVVLDCAWLSAYLGGSRNFPDMEYFGGRILPLWQNDKPRWLVDPSMSLISGLLGHYDLGDIDREFDECDLLPFGANFAIRRSLAKQQEPFRLDLGVSGGSSGRGEEAEYMERARCAGATGAYLGSAACYHAQDSARFKPSYLYRYGIEKGRTEVLTGNVRRGSRAVQLDYALRGIWQLLKGRGDRFRQCVINIGIQEGLRRESESH